MEERRWSNGSVGRKLREMVFATKLDFAVHYSISNWKLSNLSVLIFWEGKC